MQDDEDDAFTLDHLDPAQWDENSQLPGEENTRRLIRTLADNWLRRDERGQHLEITELLDWLKAPTRLNFDDLRCDATWSSVYETILKYRFKFSILFRAITFHDLNAHSSEYGDLLADVARTVYSCLGCFLGLARTLNCANHATQSMRVFLPLDERGEDEFRASVENEMIFSDKKPSDFQRAYAYLIDLLDANNYMRVGESFYERVLLVYKYKGTDRKIVQKTSAYQEYMTIEKFVNKYTAREFNHQAWLWTAPHNTHLLVRDLRERPLPSAPDLKEHSHLRSYAGIKDDPLFRCAGVYDSAQDVFFPYALSHAEWGLLAERQQRLRRRYDPAYTCTAPSARDVPLVHLDCPFPYSTYDEALRADAYATWRNADAHECVGLRALDCPELGRALAAALPAPHSAEDVEPSVVGRTWQKVTESHVPATWRRLRSPVLATALWDAEEATLPDEDERARDWETGVWDVFSMPAPREPASGLAWVEVPGGAPRRGARGSSRPRSPRPSARPVAAPASSPFRRRSGRPASRG